MEAFFLARFFLGRGKPYRCFDDVTVRFGVANFQGKLAVSFREGR